VYAAFNTCIERATGEFLYIATSDDSMELDCLEKMVATLDAHADCGLCHCGLRIIDDKGNDVPMPQKWENEPGPHFYGDLLKFRHIRFAPYDSLVCMALRTVYTSVTQLMMRHELADEAGPFPIHWGPFGDLAWQMRASLVTNTIHVPETLATWRRHPAQATRLDTYWEAVREGWFCEMVESALNFVERRDGELAATLRASRASKAYRDQQLHFGLHHRRKSLDKVRYAVGFCGTHPSAVWRKIASRFSIPRKSTMNLEAILHEEINRLGLRPPKLVD
jgi:hypothetical protein